MRSVVVVAAALSSLPIAVQAGGFTLSHLSRRDNTTTTCGAVGYDTESPNAYSVTRDNPAAADFSTCRASCTADKTCASFAIGDDSCYLYTSNIEGNFRADDGSPYTFYSASCTDPEENSAASSLVNSSASPQTSSSASSSSNGASNSVSKLAASTGTPLKMQTSVASSAAATGASKAASNDGSSSTAASASSKTTTPSTTSGASTTSGGVVLSTGAASGMTASFAILPLAFLVHLF